ncbi:MAG: hypothetical protein ACFFE8_05290 [Candidatus Heimdallarchaeota archaeon]
MAEMQRKRPKKKQDRDSVDVLENVLDQVTQSQAAKTSPPAPKVKSPTPKPRIPQPTQTEAPQTQTSVKRASSLKLSPGTVDPRIKPILPPWVQKPWRWMVPEDPQLRQQWLLTWGDFLFDFARLLNIHVIDLQEISLVYPFHNPVLRKKLTTQQLILISDFLIEKGKAKWWDDQKNRLRVYWKTLQSYAEDLFNYAFQNGYDMVTAFDIVKMKQSWSNLPPRDIRELMKIMVLTKKAFWADGSEQKTIQFLYE